MEIKYRIGDSYLIDLPKSYIAYTFPDIQREVIKSCVDHYFNVIGGEFKPNHRYEFLALVDGNVAHECQVTAVVDLLEII